MIWLLIFNCTVMNSKVQATNLVYQIDTDYQSEAACLKAAEKGTHHVDNPGCYFACVRGFRSKGKN